MSRHRISKSYVLNVTLTNAAVEHSSVVLVSGADLIVCYQVLGVCAQLTVEDGFATTLQQQQLIKGLKDVNGWLVDGTHNGTACVDNVTHCPHHNGSCSCVQSCTTPMKAFSRAHECSEPMPQNSMSAANLLAGDIVMHA